MKIHEEKEREGIQIPDLCRFLTENNYIDFVNNQQIIGWHDLYLSSHTSAKTKNTANLQCNTLGPAQITPLCNYIKIFYYKVISM